jgi:membrane-associated phospholipid phosphatase
MTTVAGSAHVGPRSHLRHWPLTTQSFALIAAVCIATFGAAVGFGMLIVHVLEHGSFGAVDRHVSIWFEDQRTPRLVDVAKIGSNVSDSFAVIPACAVLLVIFLRAWRRWHDILLVVGSLLFEKAIFLPTSIIVGRHRPPVEHLGGSPPTTSYFSGHVAAAVAFYFGLCIVVYWHTHSTVARRLAPVVATIAVCIVALSRLLLGMHYLSDVLVGAIVGTIAVITVHYALSFDPESPNARQRDGGRQTTFFTAPTARSATR